MQVSVHLHQRQIALSKENRPGDRPGRLTDSNIVDRGNQAASYFCDCRSGAAPIRRPDAAFCGRRAGRLVEDPACGGFPN